MKNIRNVFLVLFCTIIYFPLTGISFAQTKPTAELQAALVAPWLVTVDGISRTRTLKIMGITQKSEGLFSVDAVFGFSDGKPTAIKADIEVNQMAQLRLIVTTQTDTKIDATQTPNGTFVGTFTPKNGEAKKVTIERLAEDELQLKVASAKAAPPGAVIVKPAAEVPASCASFSGEWTGTWSQGGIGQYWLWVVGIDTNCIAKFAYLSHPRPPVRFATVEIKDGALPIANRSTGGTAFFERHGDALWARYSNPAGGTNSAVFEKIQ